MLLLLLLHLSFLALREKLTMRERLQDDDDVNDDVNEDGAKAKSDASGDATFNRTHQRSVPKALFHSRKFYALASCDDSLRFVRVRCVNTTTQSLNYSVRKSLFCWELNWAFSATKIPEQGNCQELNFRWGIFGVLGTHFLSGAFKIFLEWVLSKTIILTKFQTVDNFKLY